MLDVSATGDEPRMNTARLFAQLPNLISLARLLMAPLAVNMILSQRFVAAFAIFLVAGVSDGIDGYLAKRFRLTSELGAHLDPLADKVLLDAIYVTLAAISQLPTWLAILIVSRDLLILGAVAVSWRLGKPIAIRPALLSKVNTAVQIAFAAFLLGSRAFGFEAPLVQDVFGGLAAASTLGSGAVYIGQWLDHMGH